MRIICRVVCVFVNHALTSVWNATEKNLFRAGMNRWLRRKYFVEKTKLDNRYEKILVLGSEVHSEKTD